MKYLNWLQTKVIHGSKIGKKIGFPTLNLENPSIIENYKQGVYAAKIRIKDKEHGGVLYFGPRVILEETKNVLEIHVFDFSEEIYGTVIYFKVLNFIRPVKNFSTLEELKFQINKDSQKAKFILKNLSN